MYFGIIAGNFGDKNVEPVQAPDFTAGRFTYSGFGSAVLAPPPTAQVVEAAKMVSELAARGVVVPPQKQGDRSSIGIAGLWGESWSAYYARVKDTYDRVMHPAEYARTHNVAVPTVAQSGRGKWTPFLIGGGVLAAIWFLKK